MVTRLSISTGGNEQSHLTMQSLYPRIMHPWKQAFLEQKTSEDNSKLY